MYIFWTWSLTALANGGSNYDSLKVESLLGAQNASCDNGPPLLE